jgi:hypothetical protein
MHHLKIMKIVVLKKKKANGNETENDAQQCEMKCQVTSHLPRKKKRETRRICRQTKRKQAKVIKNSMFVDVDFCYFFLYSFFLTFFILFLFLSFCNDTTII